MSLNLSIASKKNHNHELSSRNSAFCFRILSFHLTILPFLRNSEFTSCNCSFYSLNLEFTSCNSDFFPGIHSLHLAILLFFLRILSLHLTVHIYTVYIYIYIYIYIRIQSLHLAIVTFFFLQNLHFAYLTFFLEFIVYISQSWFFPLSFRPDHTVCRTWRNNVRM